MTLHRFLIRYTTHKLIELMYESMQPFGLPDIDRLAKEKKLNFEKEVKAFNAEDALTQLRASEGGSLAQPPFVLAIEPLPDPSSGDGSDFMIARQAPYERSKVLREKWTEKDINIELGNETEPVALCACGAVAVQWRKDTPVCGQVECLRKVGV
jgi:hypothetical protein